MSTKDNSGDNKSTIIKIDGSHLEGGGQILRISTVLSSLLKKPVQIDKIRAGRPKPGLAEQHLNGLLLAKDITGGILSGGHIGSTAVQFTPRQIKGGEYHVNTRTAASISLILQTAIPILLFARNKSYLKLYGGTHVPFAPFIEYFTEVLSEYIPCLKEVDIYCDHYGFYPKGGGHVSCSISPHLEPLQSFQRINFGTLKFFSGCIISSNIPNDIINKNIQTIHRCLKSEIIKDQNKRIEINRKMKKSQEKALAIIVEAIGCQADDRMANHITYSTVAQRNELFTDQPAKRAAQGLIKQLRNIPAVDQYTQDQLIIYMALASGQSRILAGEITTHTKTAIWVCEQFTEAKFTIKPQNPEATLNLIECEGIGYRIDQYY